MIQYCKERLERNIKHREGSKDALDNKSPMTLDDNEDE